VLEDAPLGALSSTAYQGGFMTAPKVSVCIPVYNRAHYIKTAIDSILPQSFSDFELIAVDDGSSDASRDVVRSYADPRVRLECNPHNLGIPATRNRCLALARGEYTAILDSDDCAYPHRLARQVAFLERHPDHAVVGGWAAWMDDAGRSLGKIKRRPIDSDAAAATTIFKSPLQNSAVLGRTAILRRYGYREDYDLSSDFELWVRLSRNHKVSNLPEAVVRYRAHTGRTTQHYAERVVDRQRAIYRDQLDGLEVDYNEIDLERHRLLPRLEKYQLAPDAEFLDWAEHWLVRLLGANRLRRCYPSAAFSRMLGWAWCMACYSAARHGRAAAWRRFWRSSLRDAALAGLARQATLHTVAGFSARRKAGVIICRPA
jgi:glycosyltransferase involved in cell wall biosynthesis